MVRVAHGHHDEVVWHFMTVGHTKFRPDEGFGQIRRHIEPHENILSIGELKAAIEDRAHSNQCVMFPTSEVQDWKAVSKFFRRLDGIRNYFAYKMHIRAVFESRTRKVIVVVYYEPDAENPNRSVMLQKPCLSLPSFQNFDFIPVKELTPARRESLQNDEYQVLQRNRVEMFEEAKS